MAVIKSTDKTITGELLDLRQEMALLSPTDTPLSTLIYGRGQIVEAKDVTVTWREKLLNGVRGTLIVEGAEAGSPIQSSRTMKSNIMQILEKVVAITGTSNVLRPYGIGDEYQVEIQDRLIELKRDLEWYIINGTKTLEDGTTPRQMNGLLNMFDSSHVLDMGDKLDTAEGQLTEKDIIDGMQKVWTAGAQGEYYLFANATEKRLINALLKDSTSTKVEAMAGNNSLGILVQKIETDFGIVNIVLNRHMPTGTIMGVDLSMVEIAELRPAFYEDLAKTGDYKKGHIIQESSVKLLNSKAGFVIKGITK